jgi:hypothetical protein
VVRDLLGAVVGHVPDRNPGRLRREPIDLVHADAVAEDPHASLEAAHSRRVEPAHPGDDDGIGGSDRRIGGGVIRRNDQVDAATLEDRLL